MKIGEKENGRALLIFLKAPVPGHVKTRLAAEYGNEFACRVYKELAENIILSAAGCRAGVTLCYYPEWAGGCIEAWLGQGYDLRAQEGGDLGRRMENAFLHAFSGGAERAVLIGTDIPGLDAGVLRRAYEALDENNCVIGPALDGGYYLIGFRRNSFCAAVFRNMEWSCDSVLKKTVQILESRGLDIFPLEAMNDIDTPEDYRNYMRSGPG